MTVLEVNKAHLHLKRLCRYKTVLNNYNYSFDIIFKMSQEKFELRVITYMCPSHPVEMYELIVELLEKALDCHATLQYESRSPGPIAGRPDPFTKDKIDLGESFGIIILLTDVHFYI